MRPSSLADKESSRERILDGAAEEFAAAGFAGARIDRIARRTRLNVRMIYYHFGSKKGVYRAVLAEHLRADEPHPRGAAAVGAESHARGVRRLRRSPDRASALRRRAGARAPRRRQASRRRCGRSGPSCSSRSTCTRARIVEEGIKAGELKPLDPALTVMTMTSIICFLTAARHSHALFLDRQARAAIPTPGRRTCRRCCSTGSGRADADLEACRAARSTPFCRS